MMSNMKRSESQWSHSSAPTRRNSTGSITGGSPVPPDYDLDMTEKARGKLVHHEREGSGSSSSRSPFHDDNHHHHITDEKLDLDIEKQHDLAPIIIDINDPNRPKLPLRQRLHHFTWAWYTLPMSTGGLSLLIFAQPFQFPGLRSIGLVVYILNIVIFSLITMTMITRFFFFPGDMSKSLTHPREGFFLPTFFLAVATLITSTERYAIPPGDVPLRWAIQASFWGYLIITFILALGQYSYVFAAHSFGLQTMMPTWILPIFPIMLTGTIASVIGETQPDDVAMPIIVAGLTCQGLGLSVAVLMYAHMVGRLMQTGLPHREHRPGLFMCVGPPAFTALALIGMAKSIPETQIAFYVDIKVIKAGALITAIFLWALSLWWFGIAVIAVIQAPPVYFHLGWWAMVFPNTGFILATISISKELNSDVAKWVATGMSIMLLTMYVYVFFNHVKAVLSQDIMYPGRDEDVEDH